MARTTVFSAIRLPDAIVQSLTYGSTIAIVSPEFMESNKQFVLCSESNFGTVEIESWAKCEDCKVTDEKDSIALIALHTGYSVEFLTSSLENSGTIFLSYLRVYKLPTPIEITSQSSGYYVYLNHAIHIDDLSPVLSDKDFEIQKQRLLNLQHPESIFEKIERNLKDAEDNHRLKKLQNSSWVSTISTLGDRSIEQDEGKSSYQAGTDFENIVKDSLAFLGFTIDEAYKGGAGGLDLFCSKPYPLTGECKAGSRVPSGTTEELIKLGGMRLGKDKFLASNKLIIGAGKVNNDVITAAHEWQVSIIKAMTLQKLVELKAKYNGAINLFELKEYLQAGQIDDKIYEYIQKVEGEIKLRAHIVEIIKNFLQNNALPNVDINVIFGIYGSSNSPRKLSLEELRDLLIELSSPLTGYLGRVERDGKRCDQFYYLRDLAGDE